MRGAPNGALGFDNEAQRTLTYSEASCKTAVRSIKTAKNKRSEPVSILRQAVPKRCNRAYTLSAFVVH
jgi:hypothetical protein